MANKLIACKLCNAQMAGNAKACPSCGAKNKKPFLKRWWFWVIVVFVLLIIIMSFADDNTSPTNEDYTSSTNNGNNTSTTTEKETTATSKEDTTAETSKEDTTAEASEEDTTAETSEEETTTATERTNGVGDTVTNDGLELTLVNIDVFVSDNQFSQPDNGNIYIKVDLFATNIKTSGATTVSGWDFTGYADGESIDQAYLYPDGIKSFSGEVAAGKKLTGSIFFEVPENTKVFELHYTPNIWDDERFVFVKEF